MIHWNLDMTHSMSPHQKILLTGKDETSFWLNICSFIWTLLTQFYYSFLDGALQDTSGHCLCRCHVFTNCLLGLCCFVFILNDYSHIPAPYVVCHLSFDSCG